MHSTFLHGRLVNCITVSWLWTQVQFPSCSITFASPQHIFDRRPSCSTPHLGSLETDIFNSDAKTAMPQRCSQKLMTAFVQASEYTRTSQLDSITIPQAPRLGSQVIEVQGLNKSYGDRLLMKDLTFSVPPGSVVGEHLAFASLMHCTHHLLHITMHVCISHTMFTYHPSCLHTTDYVCISLSMFAYHRACLHTMSLQAVSFWLCRVCQLSVATLLISKHCRRSMHCSL